MSHPEIQQEIEQTRQHLGQTVEELAARADLKARGRAKAAEIQAKASGKATQVKAKSQGKATELYQRVRHGQMAEHPWPAAVTAGSLVIIGSLVAWRWRIRGR